MSERGTAKAKSRKTQAAPYCKDCVIKWRGRVTPPASPAHLYVTLASMRTQVTRLVFGKEVAEPRPMGELLVFKFPRVAFAAAECFEFKVDADGELPVVTGVSLQVPPPESGGEAAEVATDLAAAADLSGQLADRMKKLLETRAAQSFDPFRVERRFFLQFDAWTNATVAKWLVEPARKTFRDGLSSAAKALFVDAMPHPFGSTTPLFIDVEGLTSLAGTLYEKALSRGQALPEGPARAPRASLDLDLTMLRFTPNQTPDEPSPAFTPEQAVIDRVATFLEAIFGMHPHAAAAASAPANGLTQFERTFALFASGHLNFVSRLEPDPYQCELNCEPDSAFFFCFAEFAIQVCRLLENRRPYWFPLVRLFVALEDAFLEAYAPRLGPHCFDQYKRERRWMELVPEPELYDHVRRFMTDHPDVSSLEKLTMIHSTNALYAAKDMIFKPRPVDGSTPN